MTYTFGKKLQKLRKKHGYTVEELATIIGVPSSSVYMWECDELYPEDDILLALSKLYKLQKEELIIVEVETQDVSYAKYSKKTAFINWLTGSFTIMVCIITYLCLGFIGNYWHPGWVIFLLIPVVPSIALCIRKRSLKYFCFPIALVGIYLLIGFITGLWHPYWVIFLTIPVYYALSEGISILTGKKIK